MPEMQIKYRTAKGLYSFYNKIHGIPEGGLLECEGAEINRPDTLSKMRGRTRYGTVAAAKIEQLLEFEDRLIRHHGTTLQYDSDGAGTWANLTGSFSPPDSANRIRSVETLLALYFTTSLGPYKKATLADAPVRAGIHEALDLNLATTGTGAGMFTVDSQVAYRITFGRRDANDKFLEGAPSWREVIANAKTTGLAFANAAGVITVTHVAHGFTTGDIIEVSASSDVAQVSNGSKTITVTGVDTYTFAATGAGAGGTLTDGKLFNVNVNFTIPTDIVAGDFVRIYRTAFSATAATSPGDEFKLVMEEPLVSGDITAGTKTYLDVTDEAFLGENLYTNQGEQGILQANARPPYAKDIALWKGHLWYLNTRQPHAKELTFLDTAGLVDGTSSVTLTSGSSRTYTFAAAENIGTQSFKRFTAEATEAQNVEKTMKSFCKVVNRDTGQTLWEARYVSGEDDNPGIVEIRRRTVADVAVTFTCDAAGTGDNFSPALPTSGVTVTTVADTKQNGLYRSKFEQGEAVPLLNFDVVGAENRAGIRILALRDSLIVLKEDGIYRVSGETDGASGATFSVSQLDPSIQVVAPEAACVLNNSVFALSTQGVIRANESGTDLVSYQIEDDLKELFAITNYETLVFAAPYESAREYRLYIPDVSGDTFTKRARVYNYLTNGWYEREKNLSAARVLFTQDRLYEAQAEDFFVLQERKSFNTNAEDYKDEDIAVTVTATGTTTNAEGDTVSTVTVDYTYSFDMQTGFYFKQGIEAGIVESFTEITSTSFLLVLDTLLNPATGAATLSLPINTRIRWKPEAIGDAAVMKQFPEVQLYMEADSALLHRVGFSSDVDAAETLLDIRIPSGFGWGEGPWGDFGWGDEGQPPSTPIRAMVPRTYQRCRALTVIYEHRRAQERFDLAQLGFVFRGYGKKTVRTPR